MTKAVETGLTGLENRSDRFGSWCNGEPIRRTRGVIVKLASEGSKFAVDAVPAEEYSLRFPNLPLRGVYHTRGSLVLRQHLLDYK